MSSKSISKNVVFKFILNIFNIIIPILVGPYIARVFNPDLLGQVNLAESYIGYFYIFATFGIYQYGLREISKVRHDKKKLSSVFTSLFLITILTNVVTTLIYIIFINFKFGGEPSYATFLILSFNLLSNIFYTEWANEALENYDFITIKTIVIRLIYVVLLIVLVKGADDFKTYLWLLVLSNILNYAISFFYIKRSIPFRFKGIEIFKHIRPMFLVVILSNSAILFTQLDKVMIGDYINEASVSFYYMAQRIMTIVSTMTLTVIHVTIPRLTNYSEQNEDNYISLLNKISKVYFCFLFPAAVGMFVLAPEIIKIYGGEQYLQAINPMAAFAVYMIVTGIEGILSNQIIYVKRKEKNQVIMIFGCGIINLIMNNLLIKFNSFTPTTAIVTTMISYILVVMLEYVFIKYKMNVNFKIFSLDKMKYLYISLVFIPITLIIRLFVSNFLFIALLGVVVNGLLYIFILVLTKDEIMIMFINKLLLKNKLLNKMGGKNE